MYNKLKNKKGFTLIELLATMVIIGILVLLATPSFINHVEEAKLTQIKNDINVSYQTFMDQIIKDKINIKNLDPIYIKTGLNKDSKNINDLKTLRGNTYDITKFINSNLDGRFIINEEGEIIYSDLSDKWIAKDKDFEFIEDSYFLAYEVDGKGKGYFKYIGNNKIVEIPNTIQGHPMTSYYKMFENTNVEKVISSNPNITSMNSMFVRSKATKIDVSNLNTEEVTNMEHMFKEIEANKLNLSSFNTSNVTNMSHMFSQTLNIEKIDLSSFNTYNVTNMSHMFYNCNADNLDLSSFNTKNVKLMGQMFDKSKATKIIFGNNFNTSVVRSMDGMFRSSKAKELDLSSFNTKNVEFMSGMFEDSEATKITFNKNFTTSKINNTRNMFNNSQATELDLSSFDVSNVTVANMRFMFKDSKAKIIYARTQKDIEKYKNNTTKVSAGTRFIIKR